MAQLINVKLSRFDSQPWGFRLQGGKDFGVPLVIQKVNGGSLAEKAGLQAGDALIRANDVELFNLRHKEAQDALVRAGNSFELAVQRGGSTWKPTVTPVGPTPPVGAHAAPVTKTSLAAHSNVPASRIGSAHNVSARPFAPQVNGSLGTDTVKSIVNKQYNSPVGMYSEETIAETLSAQAEVLAGGVLGVNFKKNEKNYNAEKSEVFKMVQEIDKEPKEPEPAAPSGPSYFSRASHAVGGRATSPCPLTPLAQQLPPPGSAPSAPFGATTATAPTTTAGASEGVPNCGDCGRLIVGVFVRIKDKNLHVECFKCATCGTSLKNVGYYNINNKLYCDVHAKLVARQNPPAPNLEPVTIPPGSRIPSSTISSALASAGVRPSPLSAPAPAAPPASRPLPTVAPLSPSSPQPGTLGPMPFHAPSSLAGPKPFGSVSSSTTARPVPGNSKFAWPPKQGDQYTSSVPTATPLYIPPPNLLSASKSDEANSKMTVPQFSQNNIPEATPQVPTANIVPSEGTSVVVNEQQSETITAFPQSYTDFLQTQWNAVSSVNSLKQETQSPANEQYETQAESDIASEQKDKVESILQNKASTFVSNLDFNQSIAQELTQVQQRLEQPDSVTLEGTVSNTDRTQAQPQTKAVVNEQQRETTCSIPPTFTQTIRTVKISEEFSHDRKETEILKASSGGVVTETVKTGATESNIKLESVKKSTEVALQGSQNFPEVISPGKPKLDTVTSEDIYEYAKLDNYVTKSEMQKSSELHQNQVIDKETKKDTFNYVTNQEEAQERKHDQEVKDYFVSSSGQVSGLALPDTASSLQKQIAQRQKSPPPPPRSSPIDPQLKSFTDQKKRISMLEALTVAPEKPYSQLSADRADNVSYTALLALDNMPLNMKQDSIKIVSDQELVGGRSETKLSMQPREYSSAEQYSSTQRTVKNEQTKGQLKVLQEENRKETEYTILPQQQATRTSQVKDKKLSTKTGLCMASVVPHYQQDLERYQMQCALSPAPHFRVPGSRSPSPAPIIDPEASKHAYRFGAPLEPRGMHKSANDLQAVSVSTTQPISEQKQIALATTQETDHITTAKVSHQEKSKQTKHTSLVEQAFKQSSQEKAKKTSSRAASGLHGASTIPYYQQDLERYEIQCALSPAPHFKVPGSRSPSPARAIDPESFKHAYRFDAPVESREIHKSHKDIEEVKATPKQQVPTEKQIYQQDIHMNSLQKDKILSQSAQQNIPKLPQQQDKETINKKQIISGEKQVTFNPHIKVATPFQQAGFQTQASLPFPHIPLPDNQAAMCPSQNVAAPNIPLSHESHFQPPSTLIPNVSSIPNPPFQDPKKPSCTAAPPAGGGGGVGGGKATGTVAGSTTPRRGHGILNQPGARIPLCGSCNSQIRGPFITALGKIWCPEHFICVNGQCRRPLQDIGFVEEKGELYCEFCFEKYIAPTCDKCNIKIKGDCLNAIGKHFHPECFLCAYCGKLFGNSPFFLEDGLPYCEADWNELFTTKCFACGFPIEAGDRWVEALNNNYHSQCFNCTNCKKNLEGESFYAKGGRPFCKAHAR